MIDVFVYGSLKKSYWNHTLMQDSVFVGEATTNETFFMHDVGFPYVFDYPVHDKQPSYPVKGEVYSVPSEVLRDLDCLEGVPYHYQRRIVEVNVNGEVMSAYMYVTHPDHLEGLSGDEGKCKVEDGKWVWG